jgi:methylated-DNA-[protein]-cysteine S-methyltransferase
MTTSFAAQARLSTPLGPMTAAATAQGLAGLWFDGQKHHPGELDAPHDAAYEHIALAARELDRYWRHGLRRFSVPLDPQGSPFQRAVWRALLGIDAGQIGRYGQIAAALDRPQAARAVGAAVGRNPVSVIIPCHRVLGSGGALTGYAGGLDRKQALLEHEGALARSGLLRAAA